MAGKPKIVCFAGSLRKDSFNKKMVKVAMRGAERAGAEVTFIDLKDYPMPIYDGDIEAAEGLPENAKKLKAILKAHQGFLIAAPEYNSSISAALKNMIDWTSRPHDGDKPLDCFAGKVAGIMAASPGALGGLRGLVTLRSILENIQMMVIPNQVALSVAHEAFDEAHDIKDEKKRASIEAIGERLAQVAAKLFAE
jgi:NAD(P)H-dependent FMN reductase